MNTPQIQKRPAPLGALGGLTGLYAASLGIALYTVPATWWQTPHNQDFSAFMAFLAFVVYLVFVRASQSTLQPMLAGLACGLAIAMIYSVGPLGLLISVGFCTALGRFGIDWAA